MVQLMHMQRKKGNKRLSSKLLFLLCMLYRFKSYPGYYLLAFEYICAHKLKM